MGEIISKTSLNRESIGGYLSLELNNGVEYYSNSIKLNSSRNCLKYLIECNNFETIYAPYFTCKSIKDVLKNNNCNVEYYNIDCNFKPIFDFNKLRKKDGFIINDYFGISTHIIDEICQLECVNKLDTKLSYKD